MSRAEEEFMESREKMNSAILDFYKKCGAIEIDDSGFAEDVIEAVSRATGEIVILEYWETE